MISILYIVLGMRCQFDVGILTAERMDEELKIIR
jgi:hypothetical protein